MSKMLTAEKLPESSSFTNAKEQGEDTNDTNKFPDEVINLNNIEIKLNNAYEKALNAVNRHDKEYMDTKKYMAEYRHEIDPHELFQTELALKQVEHSGVIAVQMMDKYKKLVDSPYFARIDFSMDSDEDSTIYYIGRFSFSENSRILIFDWRAPISSMFYDCELGVASYEAPIGNVEGNLTRKRQLKIKRSKIEYVLETSINIQDDVLQKELSQTSDEKMKTIIATIQKDQNQIIRDEKSEVIVIQGVAGSGKTSIALHRIAYLLYRYKGTLTAKNIVILSPNKVFADYISNVLPELGEEPIYEISFEDIAEIQMEGIVEYDPPMDMVEVTDPKWKERVSFKSTLEFVQKMDEYLEYMSDTSFVPTDYSYENFMVTETWIRDRYQAYKKYPIKKRLAEISEDILERFTTDNITEQELPTQKFILKQINGMFKRKNNMDIYKGFYEWMNQTDKLVLMGKNLLEWADVFPFMYTYHYYAGLKENHLIRHLVVDEMQDYTPIQYAVLNQLFHCKKTILGDFGQSINFCHKNSLSDFETLYPSVQIAIINNSYRSSYEIIMFAKRILDVDIIPVERHGEPPEINVYKKPEEELKGVKTKIDNFLKSKFNTLGIITKTNQAATDLYETLSKSYDLNLITKESESFKTGISVTSVQMSKGLEFDEVLIPSINTKTYHTDFERNLLYIGCTRAMHKLTLTCVGTPTTLIDL